MDFLKSKFDSLCLFALLVLMGVLLLHVSHDKADVDLVSWLEQALTTVLGAYIGLTQVSRSQWKNGGTNASSTPAPTPTVASVSAPTPATPTT